MASGLIAALVSARASQLSSRSGVAGMGRLRPAMLVAQVMLTTALLGSEGLLLRSALNLSDADRGFDSRGVLLTLVDPVGVTTAGAAFDPATDATRYAPVVERIHAAVESLPGINRVAVSTAPPFSGWEMVGSIRMPNQPDNLQARTRSVGPGYLSTLGIGLLAGANSTTPITPAAAVSLSMSCSAVVSFKASIHSAPTLSLQPMRKEDFVVRPSLAWRAR
jgi:putative ABC transport system permease protein